MNSIKDFTVHSLHLVRCNICTFNNLNLHISDCFSIHIYYIRFPSKTTNKKSNFKIFEKIFFTLSKHNNLNSQFPSQIPLIQTPLLKKNKKIFSTFFKAQKKETGQSPSQNLIIAHQSSFK